MVILCYDPLNAELRGNLVNVTSKDPLSDVIIGRLGPQFLAVFSVEVAPNGDMLLVFHKANKAPVICITGNDEVVMNAIGLVLEERTLRCLPGMKDEHSYDSLFRKQGMHQRRSTRRQA
jgi:hypothetical protein